MHQHWVFRCAECHHVSGRYIGTGIVFHHHQLRSPPSDQWPSITRTSVDTGRIWALHQYCGIDVPHSTNFLPDLASCNTSHGEYNELGKCYAVRHTDHCDSLLRLQGKA